jgi:hypothetical protein
MCACFEKYSIIPQVLSLSIVKCTVMLFAPRAVTWKLLEASIINVTSCR